MLVGSTATRIASKRECGASSICNASYIFSASYHVMLHCIKYADFERLEGWGKSTAPPPEMFGPASLSEFALFLLLIIVLGVVLAVVFRIEESAIKADKEQRRQEPSCRMPPQPPQESEAKKHSTKAKKHSKCWGYRT